MVFYGVAPLDAVVDGPEWAVVEWFPAHERALREIDVMLTDEPSWAGSLAVLRVDFARCEQELLMAAARR